MKQYNKSIKGKLFKYFTDRLHIKPSTKGWMRSNCPYCGGKYCFGLHFDKYKAHCFKCEINENPIGTLIHMESFQTIQQAWNFLKVQQEYEAYEGYIIQKPLERKEVILPESFQPMNYKDGLLGRAAQNYMRGRGFNLDELTLRGIGYCLDGEYAGYVIFPFYHKGKLVFFQGRRCFGSGPKMKNPANEDFGIGKSSLIYNQDALFIYKTINIVESITNCLTLGDNTIGISGKSISDYQLSMVLNSPCDNVVILLDDDAIAKAIQLAMMMVNFKKVKLIKMPKEKDVNDIGRKATKELIKTTTYEGWVYYNRLRLNLTDEERPIGSYQREYTGYSSSRGVS